MSEHSVSAHCTGYNEQVNACLQDASGALGKPKTRPWKRKGGKKTWAKERRDGDSMRGLCEAGGWQSAPSTKGRQPRKGW